MQKRYDQLQSFVKCGMVPTFTDGVLGENPVIGHGRLTKIWMGGLVNPGALLASIRQEKAIVSMCNIDDVRFFLIHYQGNYSLTLCYMFCRIFYYLSYEFFKAT